MTVHYLSATLVLMILLMTGCGHNEEIPRIEAPIEAQEKVEESVEVKQSVQFIMEAGNIEQDSAQGAVETLFELGAASLKEAELASNKQGVILRAVDVEDRVYYLGFGEFGYLEIIRKDSTDGEIIHAPEE